MTLDEAFKCLPHGDRICEQQGECSCGRDQAIAVIRDHLNAALELLAMEAPIVMCSDLIHAVRKAEGDIFCRTCGQRLL